MNNIVAFSHPTRAGTFWVRLQPDGMWQAMFEDEALGPYSSAAAAADELATGGTFWPSCGDPSELDISDDLSDWQPHSAR